MFYYSLIPGSESSFNPVVSLAHSAPGYTVAFRETPISEESIRGNTAHPFIVYNDTHYAEFTFTVTTLPVMSLESNHPEYSPDDFISGKKAAVRMTLFDNRESANHLQRVVVSEADVKTRGRSSLRYPQKSYRISLSYVSLGHNKRKNPTSLLDMRFDKDWILYAPFNDPEKIRNIFSHNLWWEWGADNNQFNVKNGSQGKFIELFINGQYQGIYGLMHPVDGPQLKINRADTLATSDFLYRKIHNKPAVEQDLYHRGHRNSSGGFDLLSPKNLKAAPEKWTPLVEFLKVLGASDAEFAAKILGMMDLDNAIDVWLYTNTVVALDNTKKNLTYIAKWNGEKHIMFFSPWDLDITWGMGWSGQLPLLTKVDVRSTYPLSFSLELPAARAIELNVGGARDKTVNRYFALRKTLLSDENMLKMLAEHEQNIFGSGAYLRNKEKWPTAAYADDMTALKTFVLQRLAFMDTAVSGL